jgi:4-hydroxy-4-methyl-2-oxoglutarate aldolase
MDVDDLDALHTLTVPTLANAVEVFGVIAPNEGYNTQPFRVDGPSVGLFAGSAVTLTATTSRPRDAAPPEIDEPEYWRWLASVPGPKILVLEDLDDPPGGAMLGEWNANVHRALGCVGAVVQGAVRDWSALDQLGFGVLATSFSVAHGYGRFVGYGEPVTVAGLRVETGDLLVADLHGVLRIPPEIPIDELVAAARAIDRLESEIFALTRSRDFSVDALAQLQDSVLARWPRGPHPPGAR